MAIPAAVQIFLASLPHRADLLQRLLAVAVVWGSLAFIWGTVAEKALTNRLPPVQSHVARSAAEVGAYLQQSAEVIAPLLMDSRLAGGLASEEGLDSRDVRRALYEFSYLNRLGKIWIFLPGTSASMGVPGAGDLPENVLTWLKKTPPVQEFARAVVFITPETYLQPEYFIARIIPGTNGAVLVVRLSFQNLLANWPRPVEVPGYAAAQQGPLGMGIKPVWFLPLSRPENTTPEEWFQGGPANYQRGTHGNIWVWNPVPDQPGWAVAASFSYAGALGESIFLQYGLLIAAIALSIWLFWKPSAPLRRRAKAAIQPIIAPVYRVVAPVFQNLSAVLKKESTPSRPLASVGEHDQHDFEGPKRLKMLNLGSITASKKKPDLVHAPGTGEPIPLTTNAQRLQAPTLESTVGNVTNPDQPQPAQTSLAEVLDRALTQRRIQLLYQPIFNAGNGEIEMHEVLARLGDDEGHWILPETFIPELARHGWLPRLDALVFSTVLNRFAMPEADLSRLCVNVSGSSVESLRYLDILTAGGKHPITDHLVFEVISKELLTNPQVMRRLMEIKAAGVKLSVDYFGGGQQMLEAAAKIGFDFIKLSAMKFSASDLDKKNLIGLCHAARRMGLPVVLEKIETVPMEVFARKAAIPFLQGYQLARPTPTLRHGHLPSWQDTSDAHQKMEEGTDNQNAPAGTPTDSVV